MEIDLSILNPKARSMVGLDISSSAVKMVELSGGAGSYQLERYAIEPLPSGAVVDGNIANLEGVSETIGRCWKRLGTSTKFVAMALPTAAVITKKIVLPANLRESEMEVQVESEANQYIPFALEEVNLDFQVIGPAPSSPEEIEVLIAASRKEGVEDRVASAEAVSLKPLVMDVESYATLSAFDLVREQFPGDSADQVFALVDIGANAMKVAMIKGDQQVYNREQAFGGNQLTQDMVRAYGMSHDEAEALKRTGPMPDNYEAEILRPFLDNLALEVSRALQFFFTSTQFSEVHHIVLMGGSALLPGISEIVAERTQIDTVSANPFAKMTIQASNWDAVPHDADTWLGDDVAEAGTVEAEIYAHPDGLYIMRYGLNANWLSCIVIPVSGVSSVVLNNSSNGGAISLSNSSLSGEVGDVLSFSINGGTPPYTVFSENTALASVAFGSRATNGAQFVTVTLNSTGQSNPDSASTQIYVFDWFQQNAAIPVTITKVSSATGGGGGSLSLLPASVEDFVVGQRFQFKVLSGTPPYEVWHPYPDYIQITPVAGSSNTFQVYLAALPPGSAGLTTNSVLVTDAAGNSTTLSIDFKQNAVDAADLELLPAQVTLFRNVQTTIGIMGGIPPFNVVNPNSDWFNISMINDRVFAITQVDGGVSPASSGFDQQRIPLLVIDSAGSITTLEITPDVLFGSYYQVYQ